MNPQGYNVRWTTQSKHSGESMPCGGYDCGANVWVEDDALFLYLDRTGSFDENNQALKLGRLRILPADPIFRTNFSQTLCLDEGCIRITGGDTEIEIWYETGRPAAHIDIRSETPRSFDVIYESWRLAPRELTTVERFAATTYNGYLGSVTTFPDTVEPGSEQLIFYHRNDNAHLSFDFEVTQQGLGQYRDQMYNPQKDLTFGGCLFGRGLTYTGVREGMYADVPYKGYAYHLPADSRHALCLCFETGQYEELAGWKQALADQVAAAQADPQAQARARAWWRQYWERSYIHINPTRNPSDTGFMLSRNYTLFRYMLGCNAYGKYPTKFNGGMFIVDPENLMEPDDAGRAELHGVSPDFRRWGGGTHTAQNQRLVYWGMLKAGDFDCMRPQFDYYKNALSNAELRTRVYWGHEGCSFCEQLSNAGLPLGWEYGYPAGMTDMDSHVRPQNLEQGEPRSAWIRYYYLSQIEFAYMIVQYHRYCGADIAEYIPFIESCVTFFFEHYKQRHFLNANHPYDADGKLVIFPSTALETYKDALNPTDVIAGLTALLTELSALPAYVDAAHYAELLTHIPAIPMGEVNGKKVIRPAYSWTHIINHEIPELYPVYPYGLIDLRDEEMVRIARNTWEVVPEDCRGFVSWHQDPIFLARLGMQEEATELTIRKLADSPRRFPAFWGPGHDWIPDHNWGGSGMIALQEMLVQQCGDTIYLLPAFPPAWEVSYKLHLAGGLVIEVEAGPDGLRYQLDGPETGRYRVIVPKR